MARPLQDLIARSTESVFVLPVGIPRIQNAFHNEGSASCELPL